MNQLDELFTGFNPRFEIVEGAKDALNSLSIYTKNETPIMKAAKSLDGLNIKRVFTSSPIKESLLGGFSCSVKDSDLGDIAIEIYTRDKQTCESVVNRAMFGFNEVDELKAENERLRNKVDQQRNQIDQLNQSSK